MRFAHPIFFLLALSLPLLALRFFHPWWKARIPTVRFSALGRLRKARKLAGSGQPWFGGVLRLLALTAFIVAAARPQLISTEKKLRGEGLDILLALDISGSMNAADFRPRDRLTVAKEVIADFIQERVGDRVGLVVFAGRAYTQCPLTLDKQVLQGLLEQVDPTAIQAQGTAIGTGLATALNRLRDSSTASRVVILLTDGRNNAGKLDPVAAAKLAETLKIKVYTIGVGRDRFPPVLVRDRFGREHYVRAESPMEPDEDLLRNIAETTGGRFYRATDRQALQAIFEEIDQLEKTEFELLTIAHYEELVAWPLGLGLLLLLLQLLVTHGKARPLP